VAQFNLAVMLAKGQGGPADVEGAFLWFRRAAEQSLPEAEIALAECYRLGRGTAIDPVVAREWYERAARHGSEPAARWLREVDAAAAAPASQTAVG
jgi:TPR repeat protein